MVTLSLSSFVNVLTPEVRISQWHPQCEFSVGRMTWMTPPWRSEVLALSPSCLANIVSDKQTAAVIKCNTNGAAERYEFERRTDDWMVPRWLSDVLALSSRWCCPHRPRPAGLHGGRTRTIGWAITAIGH
jgi:hypothetical protein